MRLTGVSCNNTAVLQEQYVSYKGILQIHNSITGTGIYTLQCVKVAGLSASGGKIPFCFLNYIFFFCEADKFSQLQILNLDKKLCSAVFTVLLTQTISKH